MTSSDPFVAFNALAKKRGWPCICDATLAFARQELAAVAALWKQKAGTRDVPARSDFDARSLKPYLTNMSLLEKVADGDKAHRYRLRIHGTSLTRYAGDHTGGYVEDLMPPPYTESYIALYDFILKERRPARVLWDYQAPAVSFLKGENFVGPLLGKDGTASMLLSVTYTEAKAPPRTPKR